MIPGADAAGAAAPTVVPLAAWRRAHGIAPPIRAARPEESAALTTLCLRAKASLGVSEDLMRLWVPVLTLPAEAIAAGRVLVAAETALLGVAAHGPPVDGLAELTLLCVDPAATARGVGTALLGAVVARLRAQGVRRMTILAERGIAGFYRRMGAVPTGFAPSPAIPGRMLPSLLLELR